MKYFIISTKIWIFIFKCIETVRTSCNYCFNIIIVHCFNVHFHIHISKVFISTTTSWVSGAILFSSEYCKIHSSNLHKFCKRSGYILCSIVKRTCTTHPKQHIEILFFGNFLHISPFSPIRSCIQTKSPRCRVVFNICKWCSKFGRKFCFH